MLGRMRCDRNGQKPSRDADIALHRQQIGRDREDIDQDVGEHEDRHREAEHREDHDHAVDPRAGLPGGEDAHRDRHDDRDDQRRDRQRHGRLEPLLDQLRDRQVGEDRDAEIAVQQAPHPGRRTGCRTAGRGRASARMRAMSSTVAVSPAMIAAGSPGLRCSSAKTKSATTAMTGMVARMRRTI